MRNHTWFHPERSKFNPSDKLMLAIQDRLDNPEEHRDFFNGFHIDKSKDLLCEVMSAYDVMFLFESMGFAPKMVNFGNGTSIIVVKHIVDTFVIEVNEIDEDYGANMDLAENWIATLSDAELEDLTNYETTDFWQTVSPGMIFYHGTKDIDSVDREGLEARSDSRGLHNKNIDDAVFITPYVSIAEDYGDVVAIDVWAMVEDGFMPRATLEESVCENNMRQVIADKIGLEVDYSADYYYLGIDPDTIVIFGDIPRKYITILKDQ